MEDDPKPPSEPVRPAQGEQSETSFRRLWSELKRRHVVRVAAVYAVVGWLVIQVANATFADFGIPVWAYRFVVLMVVLGFPISLVVAWAFELTPEGIKTSRTAREEHPDSHKDVSHAKKRHWFSLGLAAAVPTVIFGVLALFFYIRLGDVTQESIGDKSIAVLPLENMSPDPGNAFFADGVHEDVLTNLSKIKALRVVSRTSTLQYRDTVKTSKQIGEELNARYLVEGSVRRTGNQVRVTIQLNDAQADEHLWAESYNRSLDDIFAIQAEVAKKIADQLQAVLSPEEVEELEYRPTENQEAYDYYVQARELSISSEEAQRLAEKAVALDPDFAEAWTHLARGLIFNWRWQKYRNDPELLARARHAYNEALRSGPGLAAVYRMQNIFAFNERYDIQASIEYMLKAIAADPSQISLKGSFAWRYVQLGRLAEALHYFEADYHADPLSVQLAENHRLVTAYEASGMWEEAQALIKDILSRSDGGASWQRRLAVVQYHQSGDKKALIKNLKRIPGYTDDPERKTWIELQAKNYPIVLKYSPEEGGRGPSSLRYGNSRTNSFKLHPFSTLRALIWFELGNEEEWLIETENAKTHLKEIVENVPLPDPWFWSNLAIIYSLEGIRDQVEVSISKAREIASTEYYKYFNQLECEMHIAIAYLVLGDHDKAIETLEAASKMDSPIFLNRELDLWFIFDRLREDPRFDKLLED